MSSSTSNSNMASSLTFHKHFRVVTYEEDKQEIDYDTWVLEWIGNKRMPDESDEDYEGRCKTAWKAMCDMRDEQSHMYELDDGDAEEDDDLEDAINEDIGELTDKAFRRNEVFRKWDDEREHKRRTEAVARAKAARAEWEAKKEAEFAKEIAAHGEMYARTKTA